MKEKVNHMRKTQGFSLIEILVVVVIIAVMVAIVAPQFLGEAEKARITRVKADIQQIESALDRFQLDNGFYPTMEQGLEALVRKPDIEPEPKNYPPGGYLKRLPKDPWDNEYVYVYPGEHGVYDIYSLGADGEEGGEGVNADIGNWDEQDER
ncbi:MAG: type II secretion system protein GspG [Gammaproteobacteria bacterium]|nr:MAG: type II secretion system protein GspG [Gammaproteobacteria bacterium]